MKVRKSTQIAVGFVAVVAASWYGFRLYGDYVVMNKVFPPIQPGVVNLIGVDTSAGFQIRVVNQVAQLVESKDAEFGSTGNESGGATQGADAKRIPIRDLLGTLQGDEKAAANFVMIMNDRGEKEDWPPVRIIWRAEDIEKALGGDAALRKKLETDLNINLDGTPMSQLRIPSLQNGIMVESPVPLQVNIDGKQQTVVGRILTPYRPDLMEAVEKQYREKSEVTQAMIIGYYTVEAQKILSGQVRKENVAESLRAMIDPKVMRALAVRPEKVLNSSQVLINDTLITGAQLGEEDGAGAEKLYNITIDLTDEGRDRLWQYSRKRPRAQLLLTQNGIAVAAPRITHELTMRELTITQMREKRLAEETVELLNKK